MQNSNENVFTDFGVKFAPFGGKSYPFKDQILLILVYIF